MERGPTGNSQNLFYQLTPDFVLNAVESCGWRTTGEYLQLNSYENRVYSLRTEPGGTQPGQAMTASDQVIAKFYRPGRWSEAAIREEHSFLQELISNGVSAIAPLRQKNGDTLSLHGGLWCALFPKARARMPQEFNSDDLTRLGRVLARLHNVGAAKKTHERPVIDPEHMGYPALEILKPLINPDMRDRYLDAAEGILEFLDDELEPKRFQRIHGDCHRGNVLQTDEPGKPKEFFLIDFDDFGMGPLAQDLWMLFRHDEEDVGEEIDAFLAGYTELRDFDENELHLMEPLRGLRIVHYAAWIARRWNDPSFPLLFPNFGTDAYWFEELQALEKVLHRLN
ncbi:MAG: serine/threonine protein kinase [Bdellovibrionales bacterium]|nr:serine/threonine protein kinase [Bdellovibrionales bacterium]